MPCNYLPCVSTTSPHYYYVPDRYHWMFVYYP